MIVVKNLGSTGALTGVCSSSVQLGGHPELVEALRVAAETIILHIHIHSAPPPPPPPPPHPHPTATIQATTLRLHGVDILPSQTLGNHFPKVGLAGELIRSTEL